MRACKEFVLALAIGLQETPGCAQAPRDQFERPIPKLLAEVWFGLANFGAVYNELPPAVRSDADGNALSSWRWQIVRYLEVRPFVRGDEGDVDTSWNAASNMNPRTWRPHVYCFQKSKVGTETNVFAVTGQGTAFDSSIGIDLPSKLPEDVILLLEIADSKTHWMQPGDYNVADLLAYGGKIGDHLHGLLPDRLHALFADGEVWALSPDAPMTALHPFLTIAGAEAHDRAKVLAPYRTQ